MRRAGRGATKRARPAKARSCFSPTPMFVALLPAAAGRRCRRRMRGLLLLLRTPARRTPHPSLRSAYAFGSAERRATLSPLRRGEGRQSRDVSSRNQRVLRSRTAPHLWPFSPPQRGATQPPPPEPPRLLTMQPSPSPQLFQPHIHQLESLPPFEVVMPPL